MIPAKGFQKFTIGMLTPPKKIKIILFRGGIYYCAANITGFYFVGNILMVIIV